MVAVRLKYLFIMSVFCVALISQSVVASEDNSKKRIISAMHVAAGIVLVVLGLTLKEGAARCGNICIFPFKNKVTIINSDNIHSNFKLNLNPLIDAIVFALCIPGGVLTTEGIYKYISSNAVICEACLLVKKITHNSYQAIYNKIVESKEEKIN